ncbi:MULTISPECIES: IS630 family transposase [Mesorhizobium]|uniref:IS630 family transposase n=1 Tax=Mesorhizobium australafricanum TaxID=3072311 RepID=A0ABU4X265_9HYPH|nr:MULTISPECIES: IS630 family transposase [unclassified Mesorhizobium]TIU92427.1 MAG: IS630 family transposase [Mesorhizobium sp.]WIE90307.1 IS630 family transposase [Mesorhizobium sp. WSM4875]MDX8442405.1 IS630 family transposase [Mesorhizobium sp. VK3E]PBB77551.1 IS630 family transposase [Mesorhizobium sp. WSM3879]RUW44232.1 IS630 family transposase [Mesorhizobium sp. M1A.F.Ca.ET.072.01.1.1]
MALSMDLRERVVAAVKTEGMSRRAAAKRFGVSYSAAIEWVKLDEETGSVAPRKVGGSKPKKLSGAWRDWLIERCRKQAFTLRGLVAELAERGLEVDYRSVWEFVHAEGLSYKKKTLVAAEQDRPDVARRRAQWLAYQNRIDPARLVFIDETWTKTNMAPLRGWAPVGQRIKAKVPHGHWKTMTFLAALRHDGITAPWLIDGPINGERFRLYIETVLVPTLKPGDIVVMDNLGSHKGKAVRRTIRKAGAKLILLPKYSPDLNPIEQFFAKLKHWLRKAAKRTAETVCQAIGEILNRTTPAECSNYFANAGYDRR